MLSCQEEAANLINNLNLGGCMGLDRGKEKRVIRVNGRRCFGCFQTTRNSAYEEEHRDYARTNAV